MLRRALILAFAILAAGSLPGCAAIAFYPSPAAEAAANKVIDDIWPATKRAAPTAQDGSAAKTP